MAAALASGAGDTQPGHPPALPPHQLHHLVSDDICLKVVELYLNEKKRGAAGGNLSSRCVRAARETSYQWKAERCMADENCFKVRGQPCLAPCVAGDARGSPTTGRSQLSFWGLGCMLGLDCDLAAAIPIPSMSLTGPLNTGPHLRGHHRACEVDAQHMVPRGGI